MGSHNSLLGEMGFSKVAQSDAIDGYGSTLLFFPPSEAIEGVMFKHQLTNRPEAFILEKGKLTDSTRELIRMDYSTPIEYRLVTLNTSKRCFQTLKESDGETDVPIIEGSSDAYDLSSGELYAFTQQYRDYLNEII